MIEIFGNSLQSKSGKLKNQRSTAPKPISWFLVML